MKAAAARRLQRERLNGDLGRLLEELEIDASQQHPVDVLLDAVHRCAAMVAVLGALVGGLSADVGGLWGTNHLGDGAPHVLVEMYGVWADRAARAAKLALDAGVEERRVRLAEHVAAAMVTVVQRVLDDLDLSPTQQALAQDALPRHLQRLAGALDGAAA